jgi:hypothetical protein
MNLASPYHHDDGRPVSPAESKEIKRRARAEAARKGHQNRRAGIAPQREPALDHEAATNHIKRHWLTPDGNHPTDEQASHWATSWLYYLKYEPGTNAQQRKRTRPARPTPTLLDRWMILETNWTADTADTTPIRIRTAKPPARPVAPPPAPAAASSERANTPQPVAGPPAAAATNPTTQNLLRTAQTHGLERELHRLAQQARAPWHTSLWTDDQRERIAAGLQHLIDHPITNKKGPRK